jgi:hypothetical protein
MDGSHQKQEEARKKSSLGAFREHKGLANTVISDFQLPELWKEPTVKLSYLVISSSRPKKQVCHVKVKCYCVNYPSSYREHVGLWS